MSVLLIPVAPFSQTKSRLRDYFSVEQLKELTIALFEDLGQTLLNVDCFDKKLVYCNAPEILDLANDYEIIGIKEELKTPSKAFDDVINDLNNIAIYKYNAKQTVLSFLDLILISATNFYEINNLLKEKNIVICPAVHSAGISVFGRNPPNVISSYFSDPDIPSLFALLNNAKKQGIRNIGIYDSFRAGFDVDILQDLLLGYQYLKIFNLTNKKVFKFLKMNLKYSIRKLNPDNNRTFKITNEKT